MVPVEFRSDPSSCQSLTFQNMDHGKKGILLSCFPCTSLYKENMSASLPFSSKVSWILSPYSGDINHNAVGYPYFFD